MKEVNHQKLYHHPLTKRLAKKLSRLMPTLQTKKIIVGVSGGIDSTCLLYLLASVLPLKNIIAVYVDHNLRPTETPLEKKHVEHICNTLGVTFSYKSVDVKKA